MKELKKHKLLPARAPMVHPLLSGVVEIKSQNESGIAFIHFSNNFVEDVGNALPRGLSSTDKAFIQITSTGAPQKAGVIAWRVWAKYLDGSAKVPLWDTETLPAWIAKVRKVS